MSNSECRGEGPGLRGRSVANRLSRHDRNLFEDVLDVLQRIDCLFWACEGPTLRPIPMVTCCRCNLLAKLSKRLGKYETIKQRDESCRKKSKK